MLIWMVYVIVVSLLLGLAALAAERAARLRRAGTRWYWLAAILASLAVPTVVASVSIQLPQVVGARAAEKILVLREATSIPLQPQQWLGAGDAQAQAWLGLDPWLKSAWLTVSALMLLVLAVHGAQLYRRKRAWRRARMEGREVLVAEDVGPAVVGFLRPRIVVPAWLAKTERPRQVAVIAHEQSHLSAGDPQLFTVALCLLVFMPWNLPLWWQLRRLRNAIEVDCDARVLDAGHDAATYGETLISVGARQSAFIGAVAAMSESRSFLEERIAIMMNKPARWWQASAAALTCLSLALVATAAQVSPPNATAEVKEVRLDAATLDQYTGFYRLSEQQVFTVTRDGEQLSARITGQQAAPIYASAPGRFFYKVVNAQLDFTAAGSAPATQVVLHQSGMTFSMPRIDAGTASQVENQLSARVQNNLPSPGTEAALRKLLAAGGSAEVEKELMTPTLYAAVQPQKQTAANWLGSLGAIQSIQFQGVSAQGWDAYLVKFDKGSVIMRLTMEGGKISGLLLQPL